MVSVSRNPQVSFKDKTTVENNKISKTRNMDTSFISHQTKVERVLLRIRNIAQYMEVHLKIFTIASKRFNPCRNP